MEEQRDSRPTDQSFLALRERLPEHGERLRLTLRPPRFPALPRPLQRVPSRAELPWRSRAHDDGQRRGGRNESRCRRPDTRGTRRHRWMPLRDQLPTVRRGVLASRPGVGGLSAAHTTAVERVGQSPHRLNPSCSRSSRHPSAVTAARDGHQEGRRASEDQSDPSRRGCDALPAAHPGGPEMVVDDGGPPYNHFATTKNPASGLGKWWW